MFGLKNCKKCQNDIPKTFEEFALKRENDRIKLHIRYICFIAIGIVVWLIATGTANNRQFSSWVSFAGTITSIILSVLAIIMSITGEGKTEHIKEQLEIAAREIKNSQDTVNSLNDSLKNNLINLNHEIEKLHSEIEKMPDYVAQKVGNVFIKSKDSNNQITIGKSEMIDANNWEE